MVKKPTEKVGILQSYAYNGNISDKEGVIAIESSPCTVIQLNLDYPNQMG